MNIIELRAAHPALFCPQTWYEGEAFALSRWTPAYGAMVVQVVPCEDGAVPPPDGLPRAVVLVTHFVADPSRSIWRDYLWTSDTDSQGQRVYVGGVANGRGVEIHRHLHLTSRWGVPVWR